MHARTQAMSLRCTGSVFAGIAFGVLIALRSVVSTCLAPRQRAGWRETDKDDWDLIWADKDWIRMHYDEIRHHLPAHVRVNHFRNHFELTRKDHLVKNLKRMVSNLRREDRASEAAQVLLQVFLLPGRLL